MRSALYTILYVMSIVGAFLLAKAPVNAPRVEAVADYLQQHLLLAVALCWMLGSAFVGLFIISKDETEKYWTEFKKCLLNSFVNFIYGFLIVVAFLILVSLIEWGISSILN